MKLQRTAVMMLISLFVLASPAFACSVPVFRYAMERWPADFYDGVLIHRGPMTEEQKQLQNKLQEENYEAEAPLNLRLLEVDVNDATEEKVKELLMSEELPETLPALALWYPWQRGRAAPVWQGPFTRSTVSALFDSPVRQKLVERLTEGQTAVWIFLESGNADKDKAALQLLEKELETATQELKEQAESMPDDWGMPKVTYEFSILPFSRSDPNESMLLTLLLNSEPDLDEFADAPIIFPVFGRGRALYALVGDGITVDNIRETIYFLTGPCGCEIKMMNPGVDLLMVANWDAAAMKFYEEFYEAYNAEIPELTGVMPEAPADANLQTEDSRLKTQDKGVESAPGSEVLASENELSSATDKQALAVEVKERKLLGLGVIGVTAVCLVVILLVVVLGTMAISPRRKGHL